MLSLWKLRVGAEEYYLGQVADGIDDYYSGAGETRGQWIGAASSALGLADGVTGDELRAVLAGLSPGTGLTPNGDQVRTWRNRVPGFDLTFSAPKSVSVLYALGDPLVRAEVVEATNTAVEEAIAWLERDACFVRRGSNNRASKPAPFEQFGTRRLRGAGFIAAGFRHRTSRAGDPHLHTHVLVANVTRGPDGKWSALDGQALYRSKLAAGALYQSVLRNELARRLGVEWNTVHNNVADIAGIPRRVLKHFSKRRAEIEDELERLGLDGPDAAREAMLATRRKRADIDHETLDQQWEADAATVDYGPDDITELLASARGIDGHEDLSDPAHVTVNGTDHQTGERFEQLVSVADFVARVAVRLPDTDSTVTRHEVQNTVAATLTRNGNSNLVERLTDAVLASPELVPLPIEDGADAGFEQRWTTRRLLDIEADLLTMFHAPNSVHHCVDEAFVEEQIAAAGGTLGSDQLDTVRRVCTQGRQVEVVVGRAGTGKTYTMNTVRRVLQASGRHLIGVGPSARAARELGEGAGIDSYTVPRFLKVADQLTSAHVVVVDEGAMTGTIDLWNVCRSARSVGAKVVLVGDHHQLPEVNAGGGFAAALDAAGDQAAHLTVNRRQREPWEHTALDHLRNGNVAQAWEQYLEHDRIVLADTVGHIHDRAVTDWWNSYVAGSNAQLLAGTRNEARALNALARLQLAESGQLGNDTLTVNDREFRTGDRIVLLQNAPGQLDLDTGRTCRVDNGMIATITAINSSTSEIDIALGNGRRLRLASAYVSAGNIDHGYATTIHKAQGMTCDDIYVVGPTGLYREAGYVALSRARNTAHLYATTKDAALVGERPHTTEGIPLPSERVGDPGGDMLDTLERSQAKAFASSLAPNLTAVATTANSHRLDALRQRHAAITTATRELQAAGLTDPTQAARALHRALSHRSRMEPGRRVNALDWDNVGTITYLHDSIGAATVQFTTSDGKHTRTKTLPWSEIKPIDQPDTVELTETAARYFDDAHSELERHLDEWNTALGTYDIAPDEPAIIPAAIEHRTRQLTHRFRSTPPPWLRAWYGNRPADPTGAAVYDDELATLAAWRDTQHLDEHTPGYGPQPTNTASLAEWRQHLDRALDTRIWLLQHRPQLDPQQLPAIGLRAARARIAELEQLFATAPPDQRKIVDDILASDLPINDKAEALRLVQHSQSERRDWILEHWPNIIEHQELTALTDDADALAHWPTPLPHQAQAALDAVRATMADTPEDSTLIEIDAAIERHNPHHQLRHLTEQRAPLLDQLAALTDTLADPAMPHDLIQTHINRLRQRIADLDKRIDDTRTDTTLWEWGQRTDPDLAAALNRRTNHLAYQALESGAEWIDQLVENWAVDNHECDPNDLRRLIHEVAAYRERTRHTGPDPLGPAPLRTDLHADQWERLTSQVTSKHHLDPAEYAAPPSL